VRAAVLATVSCLTTFPFSSYRSTVDDREGGQPGTEGSVGVYFQSSVLHIERHQFVVEGFLNADDNDPARGASSRFDQ
jgi:hypothetical protein